MSARVASRLCLCDGRHGVPHGREVGNVMSREPAAVLYLSGAERLTSRCRSRGSAKVSRRTVLSVGHRLDTAGTIRW